MAVTDPKTLKLVPFPADFPNKGRFRAWDAHWNRAGYRDEPQYSGQTAIRFPEDATPLECFHGGYLVADA